MTTGAALDEAMVQMIRELPVDIPDPERLRAEYRRLVTGVRVLHALVDQTDPRDPIGSALTRGGLERVS